MVVVIFNQPVLDGFTVARNKQGTSLTAPWLRLHTSNAGGMGSIPGQRTKIPNATVWCDQKEKRKKKNRKEKKKER